MVFPNKAVSTFSLSMASWAGIDCFRKFAKEAIKSIWEIKADEVPGFTCFGQFKIKGTRVPASKALYFPPLKGPFCWCPFRFFTASSSYPSSKTGPLSLENIIIVFSARPSNSICFTISPTVQSNCKMASPRYPSLLFPLNIVAGIRGTCGSVTGK